MKGLSLVRQIKIEDISELTPRRGSVLKKSKFNKPPQLEEVDERIGRLVDILMILQQSLDKLDQEHFQEVTQEDSIAVDVGLDEKWRALHEESNDELQEKDKEYEALLARFSGRGVASRAQRQ
jgi:hypothetical protein